MTVAEMGRVFEYIQAGYPGAWKDANQQHVIALWAELFAQDDMHAVMMAVKAHVATSNRPPTPADIKDELIRQRQGSGSAIDAWNHIRKAISNSGYHAAEEYERLSPVEQRLAGSPHQLRDWAMMDVDTLDSVVASNVQRAYRACSEEEKRRLALPQSVAQEIEALANNTFRRLTDGQE